MRAYDTYPMLASLEKHLPIYVLYVLIPALYPAGHARHRSGELQMPGGATAIIDSPLLFIFADIQAIDPIIVSVFRADRIAQVDIPK